MESLNVSLLIGKWDLTSFRLTFWGVTWNWGGKATGWLIYSPDGKMSIEIKAAKSSLPSIASLIFQDRLIYSGTYEVRDNVVIHRLDYCSQKSWMGTDLVREVLKLDKQTLVLKGNKGPMQFMLSWKRPD